MNKKKDLMSVAFKCAELARRYNTIYKIEYQEMVLIVSNVYNTLQSLHMIDPKKLSKK